MEIRYYLRTLGRGWWLILITMLIALEIAVAVDYLATPIYRASASFAISPNITLMSSSSDVLNSLDTLDKRSIVDTYAEFLNSDRIFSETLSSLNIPAGSLANYTRTTVVITDSNILDLTVEGTDPNTAALLANSVGEHAITSIKQLYSAYDISLLDPAVPSKTPIRPVPLRDAGLALALGLVIGCGLAILRVQIQSSLDSFRNQSNRDKVSLAYNRPYLERRLEQELARNPEDELSFGLVELVGLRGVIGNLPQNLVQDLMRIVTQAFQKELRGNDLISRWDDITFAILLPATSASAAQRTIDRICAAISQPVDLKVYGEKINLNPITSVTTSQAHESADQVITQAQGMLRHSVDLVEDAPEKQMESDGINN
ncbi:MAG: diguanylate cyclase [Anaerolineaceae bacterium]|nr:diguanylate cyclase [Anaerolineaceae bacterium]